MQRSPFFYYTFLFGVFILFVFGITRSHNSIRLGPYSVHNWRQSDCASYALNYYQNKQPFFKPQVHSQIGENGFMVSEFPLIYYTVGKLYSAFGRHHYLFRGLNFAVFVFGCFCVLWLGLLFFKHKWLAFIPASVYFLSPYLYYYGLNFLPDVPALSLSIAGLFFIALYFSGHRLVFLYFSMALFCLAMLIKISAGIAFGAVVLSVMFNKKLRNNSCFPLRHSIHFWLLILVVGLINLAWLIFVRQYNNTYGNHMNLFGLLPFWELSFYKMGGVLWAVLSRWSNVILSPLHWLLLIAGIYACGKAQKALNKNMAFYIGGWCIAGSVLYCLLWFQAFTVHDYYLIPPFTGVMVLFFALCHMADLHYLKYKKMIVAAASILTVCAIGQLYYLMHARYNEVCENNINPGYYTIEPFLRSLGVSRTDKVLSLPDLSPNITLYYLNQPGYTETALWYSKHPNDWAQYVKYAVIISGSVYMDDPAFKSNLDTLLGEYKGIAVYRVRHRD